MIYEMDRLMSEINKRNRFYAFWNDNKLILFDDFTCNYYHLPNHFYLKDEEVSYSNNLDKILENLILLKYITEKKINVNNFCNKNIKLNYEDYDSLFENVNYRLSYESSQSEVIFQNYLTRIEKKIIFPNMYSSECKNCRFVHICLFASDENKCLSKIKKLNGKIIEDIFSVIIRNKKKELIATTDYIKGEKAE